MLHDLPSNGSCPKKTCCPDKSIFDIRSNGVNDILKEEVLKSLQATGGPRSLPTMLLYNERGLQLFEEITYLDEYYPTTSEIDILERSAREIASIVSSGSMVVELGSGNLRKILILLKAFEKEEKTIDYYALDVCEKELNRTLEQAPAFRYVTCHGLHGTYDDALQWLEKAEIRSRSKLIISLGSSLGNFRRDEAQSLLSKFSRVLRPSDLMLIGLDHTTNGSKVYHAYNDREGITHKFILNGLTNVNEVLGKQVFNLSDWRVIGEYIYDEEEGRHQAFLSPTRDIFYEKGFSIRAGERIQIERSLKYSIEAATRLWKDSGLSKKSVWTHLTESYNLYLLTRNITTFESKPDLYVTSSIPTIQEWRNVWSIWDLVTRDMTPEKLLYERPIKLRNPLVFYLGHIPTFLGMQISKAVKGSVCQDSYFTQIFERGIDPDVEDPKKCHPHSRIPNSWPSLEDIFKYQSEVRTNVEKLYKNAQIPRDIARTVWLGFEHEIMHLETYLYMLLQSGNSMLPTRDVPNFEADAIKARDARIPNQWFQIPKQQVTIGLDDPEDNIVNEGPFGWDNEKPSRIVEVPTFEAQARPVTNGDYWHYLEQTQNSKMPASWALSHTPSYHANVYSFSSLAEFKSPNSHLDVYKSLLPAKENPENISVRTFYGLVPLKFALDWPVNASYNELAAYATWMNARIPTFEEARSIYSYVEKLRSKESQTDISRVQETCMTLPLHGTNTQSLFTNLDRANVGFKNWHPVAVTAHGNRLSGHAEMGGVWEWTSSILQKFEGFEPISLYAGYTADFFDGKHNIILGGSWATHPRIASRKSFVNWYQRNYLYTWAGARLVRDL